MLRYTDTPGKAWGFEQESARFVPSWSSTTPSIGIKDRIAWFMLLNNPRAKPGVRIIEATSTTQV
ncbi:MAG: hypothetical protein ACP5KC_08610 [Infirmifilum sp.]